MSRRAQFVVFAVLLLVLAGVAYSNFGGGSQIGGVLFANEKFKPLDVADPGLRFDLLERISKTEYKSSGRNPFVASLPPAPPVDRGPRVPIGPQPPPPPPPEQPVVFPYKFYGYKEDRSGKRRAFFTDGDNVWIVNEGETVMTKWRLLRIGNQSAEIEEVGTGRRTTAPLEQLPGS